MENFLHKIAKYFKFLQLDDYIDRVSFISHVGWGLVFTFGSFYFSGSVKFGAILWIVHAVIKEGFLDTGQTIKKTVTDYISRCLIPLIFLIWEICK